MNCPGFEGKLARLASSPVPIVVDDRSGAPVQPDVEEELVALSPASVAHGRLDDFRRGRACARAAMIRLGHDPQAVLRDGRAPRWPETIVGSITHCNGLVAAAVARRRDVSGMGIDAEPRGRVPKKLAARIGTAAELDAAASVSSFADGPTLLWCIKEAVFKCTNPLSGRFVDFLDVTITPDSVGATFTALSPKHMHDLSMSPLHGVFSFSDTHVMTGCVILAAAHAVRCNARPAPR